MLFVHIYEVSLYAYKCLVSLCLFHYKVQNVLTLLIVRDYDVAFLYVV